MSTTNIDHVLLEKLKFLISTLNGLVIDINNIKIDIDTLKNDVNEIKMQVTEIRQQNSNLENIQKSAVKLDEHIDKINGIYETVKEPFHKAMNIISWNPTNLIGY